MFVIVSLLCFLRYISNCGLKFSCNFFCPRATWVSFWKITRAACRHKQRTTILSTFIDRCRSES